MRCGLVKLSAEIKLLKCSRHPMPTLTPHRTYKLAHIDGVLHHPPRREEGVEEVRGLWAEHIPQVLKHGGVQAAGLGGMGAEPLT